MAHEELPTFLAATEVGIMSNSNTCGSSIQVFKYMGMMIPVIALGLAPLEDV